LFACCPALAQQADTTAADNGAKARALLDAMIKALGGERWLDLDNWHTDGRTAGFYQGKPTGDTLQFFNFSRAVTDAQGHRAVQERVELSRKRDVVELFRDGNAYELTFKGKDELPKEVVQDYYMRRAHSIDAIAHLWRNNPQTLYLYEGQSMVERHLADKITMISAGNLSTTLELDASSHLPLRLSFSVQNALYGDKDDIAEEYDDYHDVQGFPTAFTVSRYKNGDLVTQRFLTHASYGDAGDPLLYDLEHTERAKRK
jgi:hypothetical protein